MELKWNIYNEGYPLQNSVSPFFPSNERKLIRLFLSKKKKKYIRYRNLDNDTEIRELYHTCVVILLSYSSFSSNDCLNVITI